MKPTTCGLDLAGVEKGEVIPESAAPKIDLLLLLNYYLTLSTNSGTELGTKNLSQQMGFVTRFLNRQNILNRQQASQEIKVKLNESRLLKFYQVKQLKENSTENSAEKEL